MTSSSIDKKGGVTLAWKGFTNVQEAWSVAVSIAGPKWATSPIIFGCGSRPYPTPQLGHGFLKFFWGFNLPLGPGSPSQKVGGEAPHLLDRGSLDPKK